MKNALVACDDLELYELARKARNIEQELDSSSESSSSSNSESSSESDDSDSESEKKKKKRTKKKRRSKSRKESKTDRELRKMKRMLSQVTVDGHFKAPEAHRTTETPQPAPNEHNTRSNMQTSQPLSVGYQQNPENQCPRCLRLNHQLHECFADFDVHRRKISTPAPCNKPMPSRTDYNPRMSQRNGSNNNSRNNHTRPQNQNNRRNNSQPSNSNAHAMSVIDRSLNVPFLEIGRASCRERV